MLLSLETYKPIDYYNSLPYIRELAGNKLINLQLKDNRVSVKSSYGFLKTRTLKSWAHDEQNPRIMYDYLNFYLNYLEAFYQADNSYHLPFQIAFYELIPQLKTHTDALGYKYKNIKQNDLLKPSYDQLIIVTTYGNMYFLYIIWLSKRICYILDPQLKPQTRLLDHKLVVKQLLDHYSQFFPVETLLLKEFKQDPTLFERPAYILDFLCKYVQEQEIVVKIQQIKLSINDAYLLLNKITWFCYKCYTEKIYLAPDQPNLIQHNDRQYQYDEWKELYNRDTDQAKIQSLKSTLNARYPSILQDLDSKSKIKSTSNLFGRAAANNILPQISNESSISQASQSASRISKSEINVESFLRMMELKELPTTKRSGQPLEDSRASGKSSNSSKMVLSKSQFQEMLQEAKHQIRDDLLRELKWEQEEMMKQYEEKLSSKYNKLDEQIAEEYLTQIKYQRYKEYLDYLIEYNLNNNPQEYERLINEYNERIKVTALNGLAELQRQELLKLQSLTKRRVQEETQQIELAMYNQKKILEKLPRPPPLAKKTVETQLVKPEDKTRYQFQFALPQEVNPFAFKPNQKVEKAREQKDPFKEFDFSEGQIEEINQAWKFESTPSDKSLEQDFNKELMRMKYLYGKPKVEELQPLDDSQFRPNDTIFARKQGTQNQKANSRDSFENAGD